MSTQYFECHVTMLGNPADIQPKVEARGWKFSAIDGDPSLGDGVKCYATRHFNVRHGTEAVTQTVIDVARSLQYDGVSVIRRKVELVVFDDRSSTVKPDSFAP